MRRHAISPRADAIERIERYGLFFHTFEGEPYWYESAAYELTAPEVAELESATNALHELCLDAVEHVIRRRDYARFGISSDVGMVIESAWEADPPSLYGRFDLAFDGGSPPKMLEYNADTPTSLLEAAVIQWHWLQDVRPGSDQFNSIWEGLVEKWRALREEGLFPSGQVHFASMDVPEDLMTTAVLMDTAQEAELSATLLDVREIGWDDSAREFVDSRSEERLETLFKLYPWEFMVGEPFGELALRHYGDVQWIEPIWKMLLSNKAILPVLWELNEGHPNLLPAFDAEPAGLTDVVRKPRLGREGENVSLRLASGTVELGGDYAETGWIYQAYQPLGLFEGNHAVIGSWVIDGEARGIGVRESDGPITQDTARFVPHYFENPAAAPQ